ncbi:outer membrane lipoprotein LolB [Alteromonas pelagimontana]|uniref:Outer-membrane lipoprotein LolB n=1 Tax=Alteromonas pelagimontana TaxID=1858656 RepID=A0A6M4MAU4_9ALTE|nr:lipoprotein insertase outer membrane protein LolB [Alteromonas pelagimontana]QJR79695.1 outer membrane lipoprotein LolB [Alteromonas pelagimontana]
MQLRWIFLTLGLLLLSACSTLPSGPDTAVNLPAQLQALERVTHWKAQGKIAFRDSTQALSANLIWRTQQPEFHFRMTNLLGITLVDLQVTEQLSTLKSNDKTYTDTDPAELISRTTGWEIPVAQLLNWMKGLPGKGDKYSFTEQGLVDRLTPNCADCTNWQVNYDNYGDVEGVWLPHSLTLTQTDNPDTFIKIRIDRWTLN